MSRRWLRMLVIAAAILVVLPLGLLAAAPARAHAELVSSDPADGANLASPPNQLRFTFGEDLLAQGSAITAFSVASDERVSLPEAVVAGNTVSVDWPHPTPAGQYRANYRVVSADGHPITGSIRFTIAGEPTDAGTSASSAAVSTADSGPDASPAAPASASIAPTPTSQKEPARAGVLLWVLGIGVLGLVLTSAALWFTRRSRGL